MTTFAELMSAAVPGSPEFGREATDAQRSIDEAEIIRLTAENSELKAKLATALADVETQRRAKEAVTQHLYP